jgi:hypothetical protein
MTVLCSHSRPILMDFPVLSQGSLFEIYGRQCSTGTAFSKGFGFSLVTIILPNPAITFDCLSSMIKEWQRSSLNKAIIWTWKSFIFHTLAILATAYVCSYGTAINSIIVIATFVCGSEGAPVSMAIQNVFCVEVPSNGTWSKRHILVENWNYFSWTRSDMLYTYVQGYIRH